MIKMFKKYLRIEKKAHDRENKEVYMDFMESYEVGWNLLIGVKLL